VFGFIIATPAINTRLRPSQTYKICLSKSVDTAVSTAATILDLRSILIMCRGEVYTNLSWRSSSGIKQASLATFNKCAESAFTSSQVQILSHNLCSTSSATVQISCAATKQSVDSDKIWLILRVNTTRLLSRSSLCFWVPTKCIITTAVWKSFALHVSFGVAITNAASIMSCKGVW
jgi:hypothetical protein